MSLSDVCHQSSAQTIIQRTARAGRLPHAYLFHGPEGVGKELFAVGLAEMLLCASPAEQKIAGDRQSSVGAGVLRQGCGTCEDCRLVKAAAHPDLHFVYRQLSHEHPDADVRKRKALDLGVDVVRTFLIEPMGLTAQRGRRKIFIVREAERLNTAAQNSLLKTLEEPPGDATIILLATQPDRLLITTRSRCQEVRFDPLPLDFIAARLAQALVELKPAEVAWYARFAAGSLGRAAQQAADDLLNVNAKMVALLAGGGRSWHKEMAETWKSLAEALAKKYADREPDASDTEAQRVSYQTLFRLNAQWFADALHLQTGENHSILNAAWIPQLIEVGRKRSANELTSAIQRLAVAERQLSSNVLLALCVDSLVNDLAERPSAIARAR